MEHLASADGALLARIRGEFREMLGLQLTFAQARLLWQLDVATCSLVLQTLVDEGFLVGRPDGRFVAASAHRAVKADQANPTTTHIRRSA